MQATTTDIQEIPGYIEGLADFELNHLPRTRPISYKLTLPATCSAETPANGLVFYIPGFGEDNNSAYIDKIRRYIAESHGLACVSVDYHAIHSRVEQGASLLFDAQNHELVKALSHRCNVPYDDSNMGALVNEIASQLPEKIWLRALLVPPHDEYQNFGVLQALDHLVVLNDLISEGIPVNWDNIILIGSSHGGYIAHLICKFAPNTINAVIDNSSYIKAGLNYLGIFPEIYYDIGNIRLMGNVQTPWQLGDRANTNFFGLPQQLIREVAFPPHLEEMKRNSERLPRYFCFNSTEDHISPLAEKRLQQKRLQAIGCEYELNVVTEADIDGKMFKTLDHGMDASMKALCRVVLPRISPRPTTLDRFRGTVLEFEGYDAKYRIAHLSESPWLQASITPA